MSTESKKDSDDPSEEAELVMEQLEVRKEKLIEASCAAPSAAAYREYLRADSVCSASGGSDGDSSYGVDLDCLPPSEFAMEAFVTAVPDETNQKELKVQQKKKEPEEATEKKTNTAIVNNAKLLDENDGPRNILADTSDPEVPKMESRSGSNQTSVGDKTGSRSKKAPRTLEKTTEQGNNTAVKIVVLGAKMFRQQTQFVLFKHKLASIHLRNRQFLFFTIPMALITMTTGILSFLATTEIFKETTKSILTASAGSLAFLVVFLQTLSNHSKYDVRGEMHASTAVDLRDLREDLENVVNVTRVMSHHQPGQDREFVDADNNGMDDSIEAQFHDIQKRYNQCLKGCKSTVPLAINDAFGLLDSRINATLQKASHGKLNQMYGIDYTDIIYFQACADLAAKFSSSYGFPIFLPDPIRAVDEVMDGLKETIQDSGEYWNSIDP